LSAPPPQAAEPDPILQAAGARLRLLQISAYRGNGLELPPVKPATVREWAAASRAALQPGGVTYERIAARSAHGDADPSRRDAILKDMRAAIDQYEHNSAHDELQAAHAAAPSPFIRPNHAFILQQFKRRIDELGYAAPDLAGRLAEISAHVLMSTLPTGKLNAVTISVPGVAAYLILFDPIFFDVIDSFSDFFATAIDDHAARKASYDYGKTANMPDVVAVMRGQDKSVVANCFDTLLAFLFHGMPPVRMAPRRPESEDFAAFLRDGAGLFVAAHEYGHVLLRHSDRNGPAGIPNVTKEYHADVIACGIVTARGNRDHSPRAWRFVGAYFFLVCVMLIEAARRSVENGRICRVAEILKAHEPRPEETHPCTGLRIAGIDNWLEQNYGSELFRGNSYFFDVFLDLAERLLDCVLPGLLARASSGATLKSAWFEASTTSADPIQHH
jgi:hypothetical protein